jgi:catechol 2,3-dioxygenase-like lactoylglutathione lyase family enzyme
VKGQHHVGITVSDLDRSIAFYTGVLGLELASEPTPVFDEPALGEGVGVPGAALRCVLLRLGDGLLELLEYSAPPSPVPAPLPQNAFGAQHVAMLVDDVAARKSQLEAAGVTFLSEITVVDEGVLAGWRWVYFLDPDGNALELVEVAYTRPQARREGIDAYLSAQTPGS